MTTVFLLRPNMESHSPTSSSPSTIIPPPLASFEGTLINQSRDITAPSFNAHKYAGPKRSESAVVHQTSQSSGKPPMPPRRVASAPSLADRASEKSSETSTCQSQSGSKPQVYKNVFVQGIGWASQVGKTQFLIHDALYSPGLTAF